MKKYILLLVVLFSVAFIQCNNDKAVAHQPLVLAGEEDADPDDVACYKLKITDGDFTDNGDGTCSINTAGAAGSGDAVTVNGTAVDSTANFLDNIYNDFDIADGGGGGPDDVTTKPSYGETLAGDPAMLVDECIWFADTSGGGILCEGSTANTNEQLYRLPNVDGADTTEYIVVADDANVSAAEAGYLDGVTSAIQTQLDAKEVQLDNEAGLYAVLSDVTDFVQGGEVNSINSDMYVDGSIDLEHMSSASVDSDNIVDNTIANADMADNSIDSDDYVDGSIDEAHMATGFMNLPVQSAKLVGGCVTNGDATQGAQIEGGEDSWALLFDATTDEGACWDFIVPETYNATTFTVEVLYSMASGTSNEVQFEGAWACHTPDTSDDLDTIGFDTLQEFAADTVPGTSAGRLGTTSETFTSAEADNATKGDLCQFQLSTDANDATNDDATGDREVRAVILSW